MADSEEGTVGQEEDAIDDLFAKDDQEASVSVDPAHVENEAGEESHWRIVGPDEFDLTAGKLSMDSPMARALMGKGLDDEIVVSSPSGQQTYYVTAIDYAGEPSNP